MFNINAGVQIDPLLLFNTAHFQYSHVCFCSKSEQLCCVFTHFWSMSCMFIICQISATICFPRGLECTKFSSRPGLCPGPRWGSLRRSPRPPSRQGGGNSLPKSLPPRCLRHLVQRLWRWIPLFHFQMLAPLQMQHKQVIDAMCAASTAVLCGRWLTSVLVSLVDDSVCLSLAVVRCQVTTLKDGALETPVNVIIF